jgi:hypothetical protein
MISGANADKHIDAKDALVSPSQSIPQMFDILQGYLSGGIRGLAPALSDKHCTSQLRQFAA